MLFREGYEGQVLCTPPTADLTELLLFDSANLHLRRLKSAQGESSKKHKQMDRLLRKGDLYLQKDVENCLENFVTLQFHKKFTIKPGLEITFYPAGHLLGAAGSVESIITILSLKDQLVTPTINLDNPDEGCDLDYVPHEARQVSMEYALCNSFGFGGTNGSVLFRKV